MAHIIILNSRVSCVVVIPIFGFEKYLQTVVDLMDIDMISTFKKHPIQNNQRR